MHEPTVHRTIEIELLALDLDTCTRCTGSERSLDDAIASVARVFREAGAEVAVTRHVVTGEAQARALRLVTSPTIRVDGRDIALELRESNCGECGDLCGCEGGVDCRVWVWQGEEHLEAPRAMIVDALLRAYGSDERPPIDTPYEMPENLRSYFSARAAMGAVGDECCDRATCCEPSARNECCGDGRNGTACGCRSGEAGE